MSKQNLQIKNPEKKRQTREKDHFDRLAESTGEIWWGSTTPAGIKRLERRADLIAQQVNQFHNPLVLEFGCGTGAFSRFVLKKMPSLRLVSCDISPKSIAIAASKYGGYTHSNFMTADLTLMPYRTDSFDMVIGNSILHHIPVDECLKETLRVLRPGGRIFFFEPNMMNPQVALEKNVRFIGKRLQNSVDETAFFRWSLAAMLRSAGFHSTSVVPFDFLHPGVPEAIINLMDTLGKGLEKIPVVREISGSLIISASKAGP